jgi:putative aldouronate transport system permease protein
MLDLYKTAWGGLGLKRARKIFQQNYQLYLLMLPALAATALFAYAPMYGVQIAFKDYRIRSGIWGSQWVGLSHFERFIKYPNFLPMLRNTLTITLYELATFPAAIIIALMINELRGSKYKKTVQMVSYAPHFLSTVVICGMIKLFFGLNGGIVNNALAALGSARFDFLTAPSAFAHLYVWSGVWQSAGWGAIVYLAALAGVSSEHIEAAQIDGANRMQVIWHINIPAILPTIMILFIMSAGSVLSLGYEKIFLLQNDLNRPASTVISTYVYEIGVRGRQFSYSSAISLFNNVVNIATLLIVNRAAKTLSGVGIW